tara:strand:- start:785 stop:1471 length:687 start_codon:yes stop_codon:yes gene_type:complete
VTAFDEAWEIAKESGPPLNRFDFEGGQESQPKEGWQDFRLKFRGQPLGDIAGELAPAGNFPDMSGWYPTTRTLRLPDGTTRGTLEPAGSNINLTPLAHIIHSNFYSDREGNMTDEGETNLISDLASTGQHEAIHQAMHSILREMGYRPRRTGGTREEDEEYGRATEWAANLGQHHDVMDAWNQLRGHAVFRDDDEIDRLAEKYIDRDYDLNNDDLYPEERGGWEDTIR